MTQYVQRSWRFSPLNQAKLPLPLEIRLRICVLRLRRTFANFLQPAGTDGILTRGQTQPFECTNVNTGARRQVLDDRETGEPRRAFDPIRRALAPPT